MELRSILAGETYSDLLEGRLLAHENKKLYRLLAAMHFPRVSIEYILDDDSPELDFAAAYSWPFVDVLEDLPNNNAATGATANTQGLDQKQTGQRNGYYIYRPAESAFEDRLPSYFYVLNFTGDPSNPDFTHSELHVFWMSDLAPDRLDEVLSEIRSTVDFSSASRDVDL